ncbi:hypothetical protein QSV37_16150 [Acinetobacter sp. VNK23]|uniref:hypothetical protein n=1 Tax=Acinetobacter thutiue TaxID=2998078 RepID=UPI002575E729|nr:hypothetical protein [Acinetobacter thutiue]MDM1021811.1 hypothetical protein [Acinetobacter thutiue]
MQLWNKLSTLWLLALCSISGIVGMLLMDGVADFIFLVVTLFPILIAIWRAYVLQRDKK